MKFISLLASCIAVTQAQNFLDADLETLDLQDTYDLVDTHRNLAPR
jgi:hypothetical protein